MQCAITPRPRNVILFPDASVTMLARVEVPVGSSRSQLRGMSCAAATLKAQKAEESANAMRKSLNGPAAVSRKIPGSMRRQADGEREREQRPEPGWIPLERNRWRL